jgi:HEAT repeat protein
VKWDLTIEELERDNQFVETQIKRMNDSKNDSDAMDSATLTLFREDSRKEMIPHLCAALLRDNFNDLYGTAALIMMFAKNGDLATVKRLTTFLTKASERSTEKDDLEMYAYVAPMARDRRVIPRLIELMDHPDDAVKYAATKSFAQVALQSGDGMTAAKAKSWWDLNHDVSERVFLNEQLQSSDPMVAVEAAKGLYDLREKAIVPVLIKTLKGDDRKANEKALDLIRRISGNDWGYDVMAAPEARLKIVGQLEKWWKENGTRFEWIEDRNAKPSDVAAKPHDPMMQWVKQLASTTGNEAQLAEQNLLGKGDESVPTLIKGLKDPGVIVRRKCNNILKTLSKKDVGYDPRGEEDQRQKGIAAWTAWAKEKGVLKDAEEAAQ